MPFLPEQASTIGSQIDWILFALMALSFLFAIPVVVTIITFAIRYRRNSKADRSNRVHESNKIEFTWTIIPFVLAMTVFGWSVLPLRYPSGGHAGNLRDRQTMDVASPAPLGQNRDQCPARSQG